MNVQFKGIFQKFYSCKTIGTLNDVKKQTCLAMSIYKVVMIILLNWVTAFRPPKFHKSLNPLFQESWVTTYRLPEYTISKISLKKNIIFEKLFKCGC